MGEEADEERGSSSRKQSSVRHLETENRGSRSIVNTSIESANPALCLKFRPLKHRVCPGGEHNQLRNQRRAPSSCRCHCHPKTPNEIPCICGLAAESAESVPSRLVRSRRTLEFENTEKPSRGEFTQNPSSKRAWLLPLD